MPSTTAFLTILTLFSVVRGNSIAPDDITGEFQSGFVDHAPSLLSNIGGYNDSIILNQRSGNLFPPLFARQQRVCPDPGGPSCSATKCCRTGEKCCSGGGCCELTDNCATVQGKRGCCPIGSETCGGTACVTAGSDCCGTYVCKPGAECNTLGGYKGCCKIGYLKCPGACCPEGTTCGTTPGYCSRGSAGGARTVSRSRTAAPSSPPDAPTEPSVEDLPAETSVAVEAPVEPTVLDVPAEETLTTDLPPSPATATTTTTTSKTLPPLVSPPTTDSSAESGAPEGWRNGRYQIYWGALTAVVLMVVL